MKRYRNITLGLVATLGVSLLATSCGKFKDFGNTDVNPNGSAEVLTSALLTNVEAGIGGIAASLNAGYYCQYLAEPTYPGASRYTLPQINSSGNYSGALMDLQVIINKNSDPATAGKVGSDGDNQTQIAVARILKTYIYWSMTDRWGDMPYTEALKGVAELTPKYDDQEFIYKDLIKELTEAKEQLNDAGGPIKGDVVYAGNNAKWRKFANSLRMLMALRLSKKYPTSSDYAATQFAAAYNDARGAILTNADNFVVAYPGGVYRNPWFGAGGSADNGVALTFTDLLSGLTDGRLLGAFATTTNGIAYGLPNAVSPGSGSTAIARILIPGNRLENSPQVLIGAAHVQLAIAEAMERGWISGKTTLDAQAAYEEGIRQSFAQWNLTAPAAYFTSGATSYTTGTGVASIGGASVAGSSAATASKLDRIALQQYIAYYPDGFQGWANWRRTNVPNIKPTIHALNSGGQIVRRYVYGTTEYSLNLEELNKAIAKIPGGDTQDARVWWDR